MRRSKLLDMIDNDSVRGPISSVLDNKLDKHLIAGRLLASGAKHKEVADATGYHPAYITKLRRHPTVVQERELIHNSARNVAAKIQQDVQEGAQAGLKILKNILNPGTVESEQADIALKTRVAQDFLDREGTSPKVTRAQAETKNISVHLDANDLDFLKAEASKRKAG